MDQWGVVDGFRIAFIKSSIITWASYFIKSSIHYIIILSLILKILSEIFSCSFTWFYLNSYIYIYIAFLGVIVVKILTIKSHNHFNI